VLKDVGRRQSFVRQTLHQNDDVILADGTETSRREAPASTSHATAHYTADSLIEQGLTSHTKHIIGHIGDGFLRVK